MVTIAYVFFVFVACIFGGLIGVASHYARAHFTYTPEDLGLGETWSTLTRNGYFFEKHVIGAKWDDNGFWDSDNNRNLAYYAISGFIAPLVIGAIFFAQRAEFVGLACRGLNQLGLTPLVCS